MMPNPIGHSFHIPVMGIGFTVDTPIRVAHLGISSVISLVDDMLMEKMREFHCKKWMLPFREISDKIEDFRAKRITAYLDMVDKVVKQNFEKLKLSVAEKGGEFDKYIRLLPDFSQIKKKFHDFVENAPKKAEIQNWITNHLHTGSVDVNIMTKMDRENFIKDQKLPVEFNDGHAAIRGYAQSTLNSSVVLSSGMNPRLYSYLEKFDAFFPDEKGRFKKKIVLKISDYRSALIQGKFLAKKGIWVSEYRVESGLNCGGHAFATEGFLLGPILEEFKQNKSALICTTFEILQKALKERSRDCPSTPPPIRITAQGGVGTFKEHQFLMNEYELDSVGWATPFLLVPEVTNVDVQTMELLSKAKEDDLYLSNTSPLGVPFNSLKGNTKDLEKAELISKGRPGSSCPNKYASQIKEYSDVAICSASRQYQDLKIKELHNKEINPEEFDKEFNKIVDKSCICVGLGTSALLVNDLNTNGGGNGVSICPGPNMAYFSEIVSLEKMVHHIYGRLNLIQRTDRPNLFLKEIDLYIEYLSKIEKEIGLPISENKKKFLSSFRENLLNGINYYKKVFSVQKPIFDEPNSNFLTELEKRETEIFEIQN